MHFNFINFLGLNINIITVIGKHFFSILTFISYFCLKTHNFTIINLFFPNVSDSTISLNCVTVTLNMDTVSFLGISIFGESDKLRNDDCGIYVGSIMKGGAVALDGRIQPGDMILQV